MCNVHADDVLEMERKPALLVEKQCKKCGVEKGIVLLRVNDVYCKSCFVPYFTHKFRACLGKSKLMKTGDQVLVAHSGGQASSAMLHLIKEGLEEDNKKLLKYSPAVLYVDEGVVLEQTMEERLALCKRIVTLALWSGFPVYITTLEMVYKVVDGSVPEVALTIKAGDQVDHLPTDSALEQRLKDLFMSVTSLTAKEDLLLRLRHQMICKIGEKLNMTKVFMGDSGTRLSVRLLADMAQGRGAQLTEDTGFSHNWGSQVLVLRPMREFVAKEIAMYNNICQIESVAIPALGTKTDHRASISRLTEQFVRGLQLDFPSTVSTVFRTGDKLCSNTQLIPENKCILCQGVLDTNAREDTAVFATEFSQLVSHSRLSAAGPDLSPRDSNEKCEVVVETKKSSQCSPNKNCVVVDDTCKNEALACSPEKDCACAADGNKILKKLGLTKEELVPHLCYGCRLVVRDMRDVDTLPVHVHEEAIRRIRRTKMQQDISEFLLNEDTSDEN